MILRWARAAGVVFLDEKNVCHKKNTDPRGQISLILIKANEESIRQFVHAGESARPSSNPSKPFPNAETVSTVLLVSSLPCMNNFSTKLWMAWEMVHAIGRGFPLHPFDRRN
jgi:hypothetical protein